MPATPIQRLVDALAAVRPRDFPALAKRAGVVTREVQRAAEGTQIHVAPYLKLCAALGIRARTGERVAPSRLGSFDWHLFGTGVELNRRIRKCATMREAAKAIGHRVSVSMLSRIENAKPVSITGVIAICDWIGTEPEHYCAAVDAPTFHVQPKTETRQGRAA